jgi:hypothetical protein
MGGEAMKDLFAKCGFNCGHCPAYKENAKTKRDKQRGSEGWKKYYNFRLSLDRMYCDGCQTPDRENPVLLNPACITRKCAQTNEAETCAHCSEYSACMHELRVFSQDITREKIEARRGAPIPEKDYLAFVEPFEHLNHLDQIRASLKSKDIVKPEILSLGPKIAGFPEDLPFSREKTAAFRSLYQTLSTVASLSGNTYAQQLELKKRKDYLFKLLWTFGLSAELKEENGSHLVMDSKTYYAQKLPGHLRTVVMNLEFLKRQGVLGEIVSLTKEKYGQKGWLTPMAWLRKEGWLLKMSFDDKAGGGSALKALQDYVAILNEKNDERPLKYFKKVDMNPLLDKEGE